MRASRGLVVSDVQLVVRLCSGLRLWTHVCEQLAQGCYLKVERPGVEPRPFESRVQRPNHYSNSTNLATPIAIGYVRYCFRNVYRDDSTAQIDVQLSFGQRGNPYLDPPVCVNVTRSSLRCGQLRVLTPTCNVRFPIILAIVSENMFHFCPPPQLVGRYQ